MTEDYWLKVTTISGKPAEAISKLLDTSGIIMYQDHIRNGVKVLDVYTDKDQLKLCLAII